jgi:hypothetical protein
VKWLVALFWVFVLFFCLFFFCPGIEPKAFMHASQVLYNWDTSQPKWMVTCGRSLAYLLFASRLSTVLSTREQDSRSQRASWCC